MIAVALRTHLTNNAGIAALVAARVYPVTMPQNVVFPCVTYQEFAEPRVYAMEGAAAPNPYVTVDCWATTFAAAQTLADAVVSCLDGFRGSLGGTLTVSACLQRARRDIFEPETNEYRVSLDYSFWHN